MPRARALELKSAITRTLSQAIRSSAFPRSSAEEAESVRQSLRCSSLALNHRDSRRSRKNAKTSAAIDRGSEWENVRSKRSSVKESTCLGSAAREPPPQTCGKSQNISIPFQRSLRSLSLSNYVPLSAALSLLSRPRPDTSAVARTSPSLSFMNC